MGKSKEPILKAKCQNFKLLSQQFEQEAKMESEKKKMASNKRKIEMKEKIEMDVKNRSGSEDSHKSFHEKSSNSLMESIYHIKNPIAEKKQKKKEAVLKSQNSIREDEEIGQNLKLIREYFNYIYRDFHYFYEAPYEKKKLEISCFSQNTSVTSQSQEIALLEEDYTRSYDQPLFSIKNLARYDCWEDRDWKEWLRLCRENTKEYDGISPVFENNDYVWRQVKVLDYDEEKMKYKVIFLHSDQIKYVSRLSLLFFNENRAEFEYRKYLCEKRRSNVDEFLLFTRYIDNIPDELVTKLNSNWEKKIMAYLRFQTRRLAQKFNYIFTNNNPSFIREIKVIRQDYNRQMKKCRMLLEMQVQEYEATFELRSLKIRPFYKTIKTPLCAINIGKKNQREFAEKRRFLNQKSFFEDKYLANVIVLFLKECEKLKKMKILLHGIEENKLPLTAKEFGKVMEKYNNTSEYNVTTTCAHTLRNLIMEGLSAIEIEKKKIKKYDFYMVEPSQYPNSKVKRVLQYFNLILYNKLKELVNISIESFMQYFRRFSEFDAKFTECLEPEIPLFVTKIKIHNKEEDRVKKTKSHKTDESVDKLIIFDPPLGVFKDQLITAFTHVKGVISKIMDLMSLSIKVIELAPQKIFDLKDDYPIYQKAFAELNNIIEVAKKQAKAVKERYSKFEKLLTQTPDNFVKGRIGEKTKTQTNLDIEECKKFLLQLYELGMEIDESEQEIDLKMFRIQTDEIRAAIKEKIKVIVANIVERMKNYAEYQIRILEEESTNKSKILGETPQDINQYEQLYNSLNETPEFIRIKKIELGKISDIIDIIENNYLSPEPIASGLRNSWKLPFMIQEKYKKGLDILEIKKVDFSADLENKKKELILSVKKLDERFEEIRKTDNINIPNYYFVVNSFNTDLNNELLNKQTIKEIMKILNPDKKKAIDDGEEDIPAFERLDQIEGEFKNYKKIWDEVDQIVNPYERNLTINLVELKDNIGAVAEKKDAVISMSETFSYITRLETSKATIEEITKTNSYDVTLIKLSSSLKEKIKEYDSYSWIVSNLNSAFLRDEDWKEMKHLTGIQKLSQNISLKDLRESKIDDFRAEIESIKSKAFRRQGYNVELKSLISDFNKIMMDHSTKDGKVLLKGIDEIQILLDEQSNKLSNIFSNPVTQSDVKLKNETKNHSEKIKNLQLILEEMLKFQSSFLYLEPIFSGGEVNAALKNEKTDFLKVNAFWKQILDNLDNSNFSLADFMEKDNSSNLYKNLVENNKLLADIIKRLNDYLNTKRKAFPRFYFVSDEDLMKILAQTKDPTLIQAHLSKCFEGVNRVIFSEDNSIIKSMESGGGELVHLAEKVNVNTDVTRGNVEIWLTHLEDSMRLTMKNITRDSLKDFSTKKRINWIQSSWPGQIVQVVDQIIWTNECENAIKNHENNGLGEYLGRLDADLADVVELVRTPISKALSITLSGLIVISVHNRDIVESMQANKVMTDKEFEWISQMRYYWSQVLNKKDNGCPLHVKMVISDLNYGFEYLGNITRLVITPLTDRCFRTLFGAYQVKFGGAPEGPAGTGKTESVKDLSKCVGVMCNVFNCTEGLNTKGMSKFFKGLASSGVWCCFDEFNRIDTEVLSVIAQQILEIQNALKAGKSQFVFEEIEEIALKDTCAMNITMNPSYSGRNDLPDNLKALFRPCAMMVADYSLIAQIRLYSFGFHTAKALANKVVSSLKLSSEQLSTQSHYDFGMRALNAILVAAGKIKKKNPDLEEDKITLRALVDVNLPKFTSNDIPLFNGIIGDLFPTTIALESDLSLLENQLESSSKKFNLQPNQNFVKKCIQLYETMNVRHALMIVGKPGLGKTKVLEVLKDSMKSLKGQVGYGHVESIVMNPKSILQKQLYGFVDMTTQEWRKGLLQVKMTELVEKEKEVYKWLIFDGPVDTLWIENMNSLLDDNKKLCLEDSSSIMLGENMNIVFEVDDLKEASPATVSRNGMVLCEQNTINISDLFASYKNKLPSVFDTKLLKHFGETAYWFVNTILEFIFKNCQFGLNMDRHHLTKVYLDVFECFLKEYRKKDENKDEILSKNLELTMEKLDNLLIFSAILALCSPIKRHPKFQEFLYDLVIGNDVNSKYELGISDWAFKKLTPKIHEIDDIFDVKYELTVNKWQKWSEIQAPFKVLETMKFSDLVIPTTENIKLTYFINITVPSKKHLLVTGNTGTGKTLTILNTLMSSYENENYTYLKMNLTAQTSANQTQAIIEGKLQKSYRKFSPSGSRKGIIFIDDLNMPQKEKFGAQPPIELLRQWMDYNGWYDLASDTKDFINVIDVNFVSAMGSVASGRTVSNRYLRHYIVLYSENYSNQTLNKIFSYVTDWFFMKNKAPSFSDKIIALKDNVINATVQMYLNCSNQFKATPAKIHYTFNLRDVSRVFQGIAKANSKTIREDNQFIKLWIHECERVFKDRLINEADTAQYETIIANVMKQAFRRDYYSYTKDGTIIFGNYVPTLFIDNDNTKPALKWTEQYAELGDLSLIKKTLEEFHDRYNAEIGCKIDSMGLLNLVLFPYAIQHVSRIARIISTSNGNALLVGVGGSGRRSLTILACFIYEFTPMTIENTDNMALNAWKDSIKPLLQEPLSGREIVFMMGDAQMGNVTYVEDINNLLNNGEIPNLFESQEILAIKDNLPPEYDSKKLVTEAEIMSAFINLCKDKIHIVLSMSPIGETFRKRIMMFPSMINCTTVDWFLPWPEEALNAVAKHYLTDLKLEDNYFKEIVNICVDMQSRVISYSERFFQELRRHYYVTPMSFIELLNLFKDLLTLRDREMTGEIERYAKGLEIIGESEVVAKNLRVYIDKELTPLLTEKKKECAEKIKFLEKLNETLKVEEEQGQKAEVVGIGKEKEAKEKSELAAIKLAEIKACKDEATEKLGGIKPDECAQLQKSKNDKYIFEYSRLLCMLMLTDPHPKPIKPANPKDPPIVDYFAHAVKNIIGKATFLKDLKNFQYDKMPKAQMEELRSILETSDFEPERKSIVLKNLTDIIKIYNKVYFINLEYIPTKQMAEESAHAYDESQKSLNAIRESLANTRKIKHEKEEEKNELERKVEELEKQLEKCKQRQKNSFDLLGSLEGEKKEWEKKKIELIDNKKNILGDILISSGIIAYLGAFTKSYREEIIEAWSKKIKEANIPITTNDSAFLIMQRILGNKMEIENWKMKKLPNDSFSVDNALIIYKSSRWPLLIDPQGQAVDWITETYNIKDKDYDYNRKKGQQVELPFHVIRPTMTVEEIQKKTIMCLRNGFTLLYENVGETLLSVLGPVYKKEYTKEGPLTFVNIGKNKTEVDPNFKLFIATKLPKPHYLPEICVALTLVNFTVTEDGMEDQMLNFVVEKEDPNTERMRRECIETVNNFNKKRREIELQILELLYSGSKNDDPDTTILDDMELINTLKASKEKSKEMEVQLVKQAESEEIIKKKRQIYRGVSIHVAHLFFTVSDLSNIEPVYQYSLNWYKDIFSIAILNTQAQVITDKSKRLDILKENFTSLLYDKVCMSLFEKDKIVFSFLLNMKIKMISLPLETQAIYSKENRFLVTGGSGKEFHNPNPARSNGREDNWLSHNAWNSINELALLAQKYSKITSSFNEKYDDWRRVMESNDPISEAYPEPFHNLSLFEKLLIMRVIRPDKTIPILRNFISISLGNSKYIISPPFDVHKAYLESKNTTPIFFILSPGADPIVIIESLAKKLGRNWVDDVNTLSLGQGQEVAARNNIELGIRNNKWIILQNCHLARSFMDELEKLIDGIVFDENSSFRLFLTGMPSKVIPISIIQNSIKLTNEPPRGLRQSILRSYGSFDDRFYESCKLGYTFKRFIYNLCFFHALILERRKYGPLGWNIPYEFSGGDLSISRQQIHVFLENYDVIQWDALNYMIAEANYGGRVTDPADRRLVNIFYRQLCNPKILEDDYKIFGLENYAIPADGTFEDHTKFILGIPDIDVPAVFGLHDNADITCAINETNSVFGNILLTLPRTVSSKAGNSPEDEVKARAKDVLQRLPKKFIIDDVRNLHPVKHEESLNSVLHQDLMRYNNLIDVVFNSMKNLIDAINGDAVMTAELETILLNIYDNKTPAMIEKVSYPSLKPFSSWFNDLLERLEFMQKWIDNGIPNSFWISGFFFTQSFLTGILQNYARKTKTPIDVLKFSFEIMSKQENYDMTKKPEDGCYIYGFYIEGASWNSELSLLDDPLPKILYPSLPYVWFIPVNKSHPEPESYDCPVYRTSKRAGELLTTGQSTNFLININLQFDLTKYTKEHWIKRGTAILCSLND